MNLKRFDGQCVRIIDSDDIAFDGYCSYNHSEYNEHEFGRAEDGLEIVNFLFFESDIKSIKSLEGHTGPYGRFLDPFGKLEEMNVQNGLDSILDVLFCEDNEHVLRMLRCLDYYFDPENHCEFPYQREAYGALMELVESTTDETVKAEANRLVDKWRPMQSANKSQ